VERQLKRMLENELFLDSPYQGRMFQYAVVARLNGEELNEKKIAEYLFGRIEPDATNVRTTGVNLRKTLQKYYAQTGRNDLVRISLRPGKGYVSLFEYNPGSQAIQHFRRGLHHINEGAPENLRLAIAEFDMAVALDPLHANALAAKAIALSSLSLHDYKVIPKEVFFEGQKAAEAALALDPNLWRAHAALGAIHTFRHDWEKGKNSFQRALELAPEETLDDASYQACLVARGHFAEALAIVESLARERPDSTRAQRTYGLYLYILRRFDDAARVLKEALRLDRNAWLAHVNLSLVLLAQVRYSEALEHARRIEPLLDSGVWPGLLILSLARAGHVQEAVARIAALEAQQHSHYVQPLHLALGYLGLGRTDEAIAAIRKACDDFDPFVLWLHSWPVFDPLRNHPEFCRLLEETGLAIP